MISIVSSTAGDTNTEAKVVWRLLFALNGEEMCIRDSFWDDPGKAEEQLKKVAGIKYWITAYDAIASAMEELHLLPEFIREGVSAPEELDAQYGRVLEMIEALEMRNMLGGEEDRLGAIMELSLIHI